MATKADFNALDWQTITEGPALAGVIVATAEKGGAIRESVAMAKTYVEAGREEENGALLNEITTKAPEVDAKRFKSVEQLRSEGIDAIRSAVALVEENAPAAEADAYKRFTLTVAERAAAADKSGGFLGIGGVDVTPAESAALDEIAAALGIEREQPSG